ncbi:MAG TPA: alpha/beta hydrolase [Flavisolibacter sp.]|jgi:acetyl esterase/lipase|nr:alpha/beta hydrolase [Flavisolibacter sp.]
MHAFIQQRKHRRGCHSFFAVTLFFLAISVDAQKVIRLYDGPAPGSETWNWKEGETSNTPLKMKVAYNVTQPTLTVFTPDTPNGTAVILIPGGGGRVVNIEHEGSHVADVLTKKGLTVFVLKYRVVQSKTDDPWQETINSLKDTQKLRQETAIVRQLATNDAATALAYVQQHAADYKINPQKIGTIGFSAGGSMAIRLATNKNQTSRPHFVALIYSVYNPALYDPVPADAPPAFIACATDDALAPPTNSTRLYDAWVAGKRPAELHIYAKGGHGLKGSTAATNWINRFEEWLTLQSLLSN